MAPKKATDAAIKTALATAVRRIYNGPDRDNLTVNFVREDVEKKLKLEEGFLKDGDWKAKSKQIILETMVSRKTTIASNSIQARY